MHHKPQSLEAICENIVKNWEIEASYKVDLADWRTVAHDKYTLAANGGDPQPAQHMLKVGTYNALIAPNEYYSPDYSDFSSSHITFKQMMPVFAWELTELYAGPPKVVFKWRHWGMMNKDYIGFNKCVEHFPFQLGSFRLTSQQQRRKSDLQGSWEEAEH